MTTSKLVLLWLDPSVNADKDNANTQTQLRKIITDVYAFEDVSTCHEYIKSLSEEKQVVLIISGGFGEEFVPKIHEMPSLVAIYIFCMNQAKYVEWAKRFSKIKYVITYLHQLVSIIESDYQNENKAKHLIVSNLSISGKGEEEDETYDDRCVFQFDLKDLVEAGELQYNHKTINEVAIEIAEKFKKDPSKDYNTLLLNAVKPVMYLLKREQNLAVFSDQVKSALSKERNIRKLSQRLLIDTLMINSNRFLRQRLMYLLSKCNAVPMTQPSMSTTNQIHRFVSSIIHIWDFNRPILLSFGIGKLKGKSSLLNALFEANFEQSVADLHFRGTIDVDFGYHFSQRRSVNIADIHGEIDGQILEQYSKVFNGFLVHIRSDDVNEKIEHIHDILKCLPANSYIRLLIRDGNDEDETDVIDILKNKLSIPSNYYVDYLPQSADKSQLDVRNKINELRESIFRDAGKLTCHTEDYIQRQLKQRMNEGQLKNIQHDEEFLKLIQPVLIDGRDRDYPLYNLFKQKCEIKAEVAKIDPYQANFRNDELFKKQNQLFEISADLKNKQANLNEAGPAFKLFFRLLEKSQDRSNNLYFLSNELRRSQIKSPQQQRLISLEIHWRNAIISSACLLDTQKQLLIDAYFQYMCEGYPFEIIDGDNFEMQYEFLAKCFKLFQSKRIFVISVIGEQNSGKSTLLNFLFGTLFEVREGRCTKGIYGTLINVTSKIRGNNLVPPDYDYILAIDTEGILSLEKDDEQYGKRLVLFCLAVSHLVLFNISGQINSTIEKLFLLCTQSLNHIGTTRVTKPIVRFILNQQKNPNKQDVKNQLQIIEQDLKKNNLTDLIDLGPNSFYILSMAFNRKSFEDPNCKDVAAFLTEPTFVSDVQTLCQTLVHCSSEIIRRVGYNFSVPTQWLDIAQNTLEVIKKYPDLTYFKEVFEREQYKKVREYIRTKFKDFLSQDYATNLIQQGKESSHSDSIKSLFESEKTKSLNVLKGNLGEYIVRNGLNENIRKQSKDFLDAQVASLFRSWEVSATIAATQYKLDQIINHGENQLQELSRIKSTPNRQVDRTTAINEFDAMWKDKFEDIENQFDSESLWKQSIESAYYLYDILDGEALPSINDLFSHLDFLKTLSTTDRIDAMNKISDRFAVNAVEIDPFITSAVDEFKQISYNQLLQSYTFFNCEELTKIHSDSIAVSNPGRREDTRKHYSKNMIFSSEMASKLASNICFSVCFKKLSTQIADKFDCQNSVENPVEISLLQTVSGEVHSLVEAMNEEFSNFNLRVSKAFRGVLHTCAVMFIAQFYYNRHKKYFDDAISKMNSKKVHLRDRYVRMVVIEDNDDENIAMALVKEYCQASLESFKSTVNAIIHQEIENKSQDLSRYLITRKLVENISTANDDWLIKYVFNIQDLIIEYFDQYWNEINSTIDQHLQNIKNEHLQLLIEFSRLTEQMNIILTHRSNYSLTFIDDLFKLPDEDTSCKSLEKKNCMAILLFKYFTNEQTDLTRITTNNGTSYIVDPLWAKIVNDLQVPSMQLKTIFLTMKSTFESCNISYLYILLEKIIKEKERIEEEFHEQMNAFVEFNIRNLKELWLKRVRGCETACPCCKRLCDVDHYLDNTSSIGAGDNRHCCQSGHQLRGMGGIRYEASNEASLEYCENTKDDDPIVNKSGKRITWREFKDIYSTWDFGDPRNRSNHETPYALIWNRIGRQICQQHSDNIIFVTKNSPIPYNHFILVLDHSGSMRSKVVDSNLTAWEHLLKAVEQFIGVRNEKISRTDRMTVIVFASNATRVYNHEKLNQIDLNRINMMRCGGNTNFQAAFRLIIETLVEIQNNTMQDSIRQTIVFMTDGQPDSYPKNELDQLSTSYGHMINNFWTLGLGNVNQKILQEINKIMKGTFMNIKHPAELPNAYAEIADF